MTKAVQEVLHYPELLKDLPKKVMYQTFLLILDYLEKSNKILIDEEDGRIVWIWDPEGVKKFLNKDMVIR